MTETPSLRIDKWLWHARFFKTRSLAAKQVSEGKIRVNATKISKPARSVAPGDVLTFPQADAIRVVRILALGERRGPAPEAQALYEDLSPPEEQPAQKPLARGGPRPTKKERRRLINSRTEALD
ncbi:RNA-binding S4 domain-containing protein [Aliiruegeria sabulilitoris]|uniref:RNA-binding S4 domain-containing protein n=1 Tax=Aliiruegeria sabulilitoris TaxID=1510458 RepID=UPI00082C27F1|nr:RNA-binding S4 domain-containing protein [Aliiruegeria sabulilitoris]NDR56096.1 RNA-binding S4 domain-containing protein [Pseudoruegeria sp. M32A2M]